MVKERFLMPKTELDKLKAGLKKKWE